MKSIYTTNSHLLKWNSLNRCCLVRSRWTTIHVALPYTQGIWVFLWESPWKILCIKIVVDLELMWQYPLSEFCFKHTRAVCSTFHYDGLLWQLHHLRNSNCYLMQSLTPLIPPLHVTVVASLNIPWGQLGNKSSLFCNLHTEPRPSGSGSPKSMWAYVLASVRVYVHGDIILLIQI